MNISKQVFSFLPRFGLLAVMICLNGCATGGREISDKPIQFDKERSELSIQYLLDRYGIERMAPAIVPKIVVIHHTVIPTMQETYEAFYLPTLPNSRGEIQGAGTLNVSSHFLVDRDGTIYRLLPETTMARHVIGLNHCAIGIENVGGTEDLPLTRAQLLANVWLVNYLNEKYDLDYVVGHHEYRLFEGHELWMEQDSAYRTIKYDPGNKFMRKLRRATKSANFKPLPKPLTYE